MKNGYCGDFEYFLKNPLYFKELYISKNLKLDNIIDLAPEVQEIHNIIRAVFKNDNITSESDEKENIKNLLILLHSTLLYLSCQMKDKLHEEIDIVFNMEQIDIEITSQNPKNLEIRLDLIIGLMGKMCAPIRDSEIESLAKARKANLAFLKKLFDVIDEMRIDLCNILMSIHREKILDHTAKYESIAVLELCKKNKTDNYPNSNKIIEAIMNKSEFNPEECKKDDIDKKIIDDIIFKFQKYVITYDGELDIPEVMILDKTRIRMVNSFYIYAIFVSTLLNLLKPQLNDLKKFEELIELKLISVAFNIGIDEMHDKEKMKNVANDIITYLCEVSEKHNITPISEKYKNFFVLKVEQLVNRTDPVWSLFKTRIEEAIFSENTVHPSIENLSEDLKNLKASIKRFQEYNRQVHYLTYKSIILKRIKTIYP